MERKTQNDNIKLPVGAGKKRWETPGLPYFVKRKYKRWLQKYKWGQTPGYS